MDLKLWVLLPCTLCFFRILPVNSEILLTYVDGFYEVTWITVFSECFFEMVEFTFLGFSGIAMCLDAVYECSDDAGFVLCQVVAAEIQDLVSVYVFFLFLLVF